MKEAKHKTIKCNKDKVYCERDNSNMGTKSKSECPTGSKQMNHWSNGLVKSLNDPNLKVYEDDLVIAINDLYPKASVHYLVCPKADIKTLKDIKPVHFSLLKHMEITGHKLAEKHDGKNFLIGYHSIPSMVRLHLHVISDDFDSKCLKTRYHWNSFNTAYFIPSEILVRNLESGKFKQLSNAEAKELLNTKLRCHKCEFIPKNMPDLKKHIVAHIQKQ